MLRKGGDGGRKLTGLWRGQGCGPGQRQKIGAILFFFNIFYFWPHQLLVIARGIFRCDAQALQRREQPQWLWCVSSIVVAHGLSFSAACGVLVPRPGIEPGSPALEGGFLTTGKWGLVFSRRTTSFGSGPTQGQHPGSKYLKVLGPGCGHFLTL